MCDMCGKPGCRERCVASCCSGALKTSTRRQQRERERPPRQSAHRPSGWGVHPPHAHTCWVKKKKIKITPRLPLIIKRTVGLGSCCLLTLQPVSALLALGSPWQPCMCKKKRKKKNQRLSCQRVTRSCLEIKCERSVKSVHI